MDGTRIGGGMLRVQSSANLHDHVLHVEVDLSPAMAPVRESLYIRLT